MYLFQFESFGAVCFKGWSPSFPLPLEFILEWCPWLFPDNPALNVVGFFHGNSALTPTLPLGFPIFYVEWLLSVYFTCTSTSNSAGISTKGLNFKLKVLKQKKKKKKYHFLFSRWEEREDEFPLCSSQNLFLQARVNLCKIWVFLAEINNSFLCCFPKYFMVSSNGKWSKIKK